MLAQYALPPRITTVQNYSETGAPGQLGAVNNRGDMLIAQALPPRGETVRMGNSYGAQIPTGSAFTFVNAWPTTRAELVLYNGEAAAGKWYLINRIWMANITSQAAAQPFSILGQIVPNTPALVAPTDNAAILMQCLSGNRVVGRAASLAKLALANTAFTVTNQWFILGSAAVSPMTTNLGNSVEVHVDGGIQVPPGGVFGIAGLAGTAAGTAIAGIEWDEVILKAGF